MVITGTDALHEALAIYRVLLPICFVIALVYVWQGMPQTLDSATTVTTLEGPQQQLVMGPVASLEPIKHIGQTEVASLASVRPIHLRIRRPSRI